MSKWRDLTPATAPVVRIEWWDIVTADSWNEDEEDTTPPTLIALRWLLEANDKWVRIAGTYDWDSGKWARFRLIPKLPPTILSGENE